MNKIYLAIILCSYLCVAIQCLNFVNVIAEIEAFKNGAINASEVREKRNTGPYYYYGYDAWYYHYWYYYNYPPVVFTAASCGGHQCPPQCPGTCGTYSGYFACRCNRCHNVVDPCTQYNIGRGLYLHPFPFDATRYIQCDARPGVYYVRNCPGGTVFDARNSVCNYGYYYYGK